MKPKLKQIDWATVEQEFNDTIALGFSPIVTEALIALKIKAVQMMIAKR